MHRLTPEREKELRIFADNDELFDEIDALRAEIKVLHHDEISYKRGIEFMKSEIEYIEAQNKKLLKVLGAARGLDEALSEFGVDPSSVGEASQLLNDALYELDGPNA